jgi:hypothetical protein
MLTALIVISLLAAVILIASGQWLLGLGMAGLCAWLVTEKGKKITDGLNADARTTEARKPPPPEPTVTPYTSAKHAVHQGIQACQKAHPEATAALLWLANADGSISKQEVRLVFKFCEKFGVTISQDAYNGLDIAPPKDYLSTQGDIESACNLVNALRDKPMPYKVALHGTAHAMAGSNKTTSKAKQTLLDTIESLLT